LQKIFGEAKREWGGKEKGFGEKEFPPRPSVIFKIQRQDFRGKRFGISFRTGSQVVKFPFPVSLGASPLASADEFSSNFQTSQSFFALRANAKRQLFRRRRNCPKAI
jgi:hypothetical protein